METITKFKADDGEEFDAKSDCMAHEALCAEISEVMRLLPPTPKDDGCDFANGLGYIQHDSATFGKVREALLRIGNRISHHRWFDDALANPSTVHPSYPGRIIDDVSRPLALAWYRVMCTDKELREWGQPFFANNPKAGNQIRLNP